MALSHQTSPEIREYERTSTTALNALLMPVISDYVDALRRRMDAAGFTPRLYLVQSNGGVVTPEVARRLPARLLLSGPSGGAIAAEQMAKALDEPNLVAIDLGGTSFDVSVLTDSRATLVNEGGPAIGEHRDVEAGSAQVDGNEIGFVERLRHLFRRDGTSARTGQQQPRG